MCHQQTGAQTCICPSWLPLAWNWHLSLVASPGAHKQTHTHTPLMWGRMPFMWLALLNQCFSAKPLSASHWSSFFHSANRAWTSTLTFLHLCKHKHTHSCDFLIVRQLGNSLVIMCLYCPQLLVPFETFYMKGITQAIIFSSQYNKYT